MIFVICNVIAFCITAIGCINWGLIGIFNFNLVTAIFGGASVGSTIIYILVLASILWLIFDLFYEKGQISFTEERFEERRKIRTK